MDRRASGRDALPRDPGNQKGDRQRPPPRAGLPALNLAGMQELENEFKLRNLG
jgi:hypothetical protein